jgi:hypothetical protein
MKKYFYLLGKKKAKGMQIFEFFHHETKIFQNFIFDFFIIWSFKYKHLFDIKNILFKREKYDEILQLLNSLNFDVFEIIIL